MYLKCQTCLNKKVNKINILSLKMKYIIDCMFKGTLLGLVTGVVTGGLLVFAIKQGYQMKEDEIRREKKNPK